MAVSNVVNSESFKVTTPSDREIRLTRLFDAPRNLVFEAMSKPEYITRWWGCLDAGYSVPVCEIDLRPGGAWRFVNRTPKGELVAFYGVYREVAPPERMVFTEIFERFPDAESVVTAVLTERPARPVSHSRRSIHHSKCGTSFSSPGWQRARRSATTGWKRWWLDSRDNHSPHRSRFMQHLPRGLASLPAEGTTTRKQLPTVHMAKVGG